MQVGQSEDESAPHRSPLRRPSSEGGLFEAIKDDKELSARMNRPEQSFEKGYFEKYPQDVLKVW